MKNLIFFVGSNKKNGAPKRSKKRRPCVLSPARVPFQQQQATLVGDYAKRLFIRNNGMSFRLCHFRFAWRVIAGPWTRLSGVAAVGRRGPQKETPTRPWPVTSPARLF